MQQLTSASLISRLFDSIPETCQSLQTYTKQPRNRLHTEQASIGAPEKILTKLRTSIADTQDLSTLPNSLFKRVLEMPFMFNCNIDAVQFLFN